MPGVLRELYENDYPIKRMKLVDEYDEGDELSMEDNNSSNQRVSGIQSWGWSPIPGASSLVPGSLTRGAFTLIEFLRC